LQRFVQAAPAQAPTGGTVLEPEASPRRSILVVDDETAVQDVIKRFLEIAGHQVVSASSGSEALRVLGEQAVDLVLLDWMIPKEDGRTNFRTIRDARPQLPILLCTGLVQTEQAADLLREPGVALMRKPFRMNELWYAVNNALS
jgi:DNA-binding response OmpR family regulator